jgi:hypothetical protein
VSRRDRYVQKYLPILRRRNFRNGNKPRARYRYGVRYGRYGKYSNHRAAIPGEARRRCVINYYRCACAAFVGIAKVQRCPVTSIRANAKLLRCAASSFLS